MKILGLFLLGFTLGQASSANDFCGRRLADVTRYKFISAKEAYYEVPWVAEWRFHAIPREDEFGNAIDNFNPEEPYRFLYLRAAQTELVITYREYRSYTTLVPLVKRGFPLERVLPDFFKNIGRFLREFDDSPHVFQVAVPESNRRLQAIVWESMQGLNPQSYTMPLEAYPDTREKNSYDYFLALGLRDGRVQNEKVIINYFAINQTPVVKKPWKE